MDGAASTRWPATAPRLGVVIPLANEERTVEDLLDRVGRQLAAGDRVYCVIDRATVDGTRAIAESCSRRDPRVKVVWAPENRCVVDAYFRGYREALSAGCAWILEMDGGLSHLPEQIPQFVRAMEEGYDFAGGSRFMEGGVHTGSLDRRAISWGGTVLSNLVLGTRMRDMTSGFECFTHAALTQVVERGVRSKAHFFQTEIRYMMHRLRWTELPITYGNPSKAVGSASLGDAFASLWFLWRRRRVDGAIDR
jgi:dolichol-phosphate mannosyltransferase